MDIESDGVAVAGESAQQKAERQRQKAQRLLQSAERWEQGAQGEAAVAAVLDALRVDGWTVLHDVAWPGRRYANIDHVVIGHGKVFVVDAKNWSGDVLAAGGILRQNGRSRAKEVAAVADAARAVASLAPDLAVENFVPVLCLARENWFSEKFGEVIVCSSQNVLTILRGQLAGIRPLTEADVHRVTALVNQPAVHARVSARKSGKAPASAASRRQRRPHPGVRGPARHRVGPSSWRPRSSLGSCSPARRGSILQSTSSPKSLAAS